MIHNEKYLGKNKYIQIWSKERRILKIKENELQTKTYIKKFANQVLKSLILTHEIVLNKENHQISNNWNFIITKNHLTHPNIYWTIQPIFNRCNFQWTNINQTNFLLVLFEHKNSICNLSTYSSLPKHKQYPTQLLNDTVLIARTSTWT